MRTKPSKVDVILHPQRMAIIRALGSRRRTPKELLAELPGLSQASLYRHLSTLERSGVVEVVEEHRQRGAVERTYALGSGAVVTAAELAQASRDDHFRFFASFAGSLMRQYGAYLERDEIDLERDGVGYREHVLQLSDAELRSMLAELRTVLAAHAELSASPDRSPRLVATVTMPAASPAKELR